MLCLSVAQPWAYCLLVGTKRVENRTWRMPKSVDEYLRHHDDGRYLIHAGKRYQTGMEQFIHRDSPEVSIEAMLSAPLGAIVGDVRHVACISPPACATCGDRFERHPPKFRGGMCPLYVPGEDTVTPATQRIWADIKQYKFQIEQPRTFATPISYRGALGFFHVPDAVVADAIAA